MNVDFLKKGDVVPDWALAIDPNAPSRASLSLVVNADCWLVELPDRILLQPVDGGHGAVVRLVNRGPKLTSEESAEVDALIYAPSKQFCIVLRWQSIGRDGGYDPGVSIVIPPFTPELVQD